jgi:hypothetical protein
MAEKKISELTPATEFNDADVLAVVQSGTTKKVAKTVLLDGLIDGVAWGDITGTLTNQADLNAAFGDKANLATAKGVIVHGDNASVARPSGYASIEWIGDVEPLNAINNDTWIDTSEDEL